MMPTQRSAQAPEPTLTVSRAETLTHRGFGVPNSFTPRQRLGASFTNAVLATALFRCWPILLFFASWATLITVLNHKGHQLVIQSTLLIIVGTVLGFVISYRTTSSFERYNEGRRLWSQITLASRTFARTVWFHVPHTPPVSGQSNEEANSRSIIEKKTVINLLEAFSVAIKHYLRGEEGIYYKDLYYLVKFLPQYALPRGMAAIGSNDRGMQGAEDELASLQKPMRRQPVTDTSEYSSFNSSVPHEVLTVPRSPVGQPDVDVSLSPSFHHGSGYLSPPHEGQTTLPLPASAITPRKISLRTAITSPFSLRPQAKSKKWTILPRDDEKYLLPARNPPKYNCLDVFPFSLLVKWSMENGRDVQGKTSARMRAKMHTQTTSHNLPLELSLYLSSYVASLQNRKVCDVPTINTLIAALNQLVDSLTGLERILTSPIPFSYTVHLWSITIIFCLALPLQIWPTLKWLTIPGTIVISFIFFGFLVAGEEIENPFGYDKNDLNLDHFTHNIIRNELRAVTSAPPPDPMRWAFVSENNLLFTNQLDERVSPDEWIARGSSAMQKSLGQF